MPVPLRIAKPVIAAATAVLVVGCGSPSTSQPAATPTSAPSPTPGGSASPSAAAAPGLLLEVTTEGGFINPVARLGALPSVVVDDDGRIFTPGAPAGDPPPLVPPVDVRDSGAAGAAAIREAITAAGLDAQEAGGGVVADTGTTVFTTVAGGDTIVNRFAAGGPGRPGGPGAPGGDAGSAAPDASADPSAAAFALLARLTDPAETWGSAGVTSGTYRPEAYRVFAAPATQESSAQSPAPPDWPLATPLASFGTPAAATFGVDELRTGIVIGTDATTLAAAVEALPAGAVVQSGGQAWSLWVRPLFPDELPS